MSCVATDEVRDQSPTDVLDYGFDWAASPGWVSGDTIATSAWSVDLTTTPPLVIGATGIVNAGLGTTVWLSGGLVESDYLITNSIVTAGGRHFGRSFVLRVRVVMV